MKYKKDGTVDKRSQNALPGNSSARGSQNALSDGARLKKATTQHDRQFASAYKHLIKFGMTQDSIATIFGKGQQNIKKIRDNNPVILQAYNEAMDVLEIKLSSKMLVQAIGYEYTEEKTTSIPDPKNEGKWIKTRKEKTKKHQPGSAAMFMFLMTNRFGENWKVTKELVTKKVMYDKNPRKQIIALARDVLEENTNESD